MTKLQQRIEALEKRSNALRTQGGLREKSRIVTLTESQIHTALNSINSAADYNGIITNAQLDLQRVLRAALRQS